jgi:murein DD-endopeptidase MepM/ murein hydrolase activator NlpD
MLPAADPVLSLLPVLVSALLATGPVAAPTPEPRSGATRAVVAATSSTWLLPVDPPAVVLRPFDPPAHPWLPGHRGVDLAADVGDRVLAAGAGVVTYAGPLVDRDVVVVQHPDGRRTTYEPVDPTVQVGDVVSAGSALGYLTTGGGHCGGLPSCLHWGLRRGLDYLDPLRLVDPGHAVLLPVG